MHQPRTNLEEPRQVERLADFRRDVERILYLPQAHRHINVTGPSTSDDAAIDAEDKQIDRRLKSICRGS